MGAIPVLPATTPIRRRPSASLWVTSGPNAQRAAVAYEGWHGTFHTKGDYMEQREITSHRVNPANDKLMIRTTDLPGAGGANHSYHVTGFNLPGGGGDDVVIRFQNGPIAGSGVNGLTQEALIAICIDRLQSFQKGPFNCRENSIALTHLETAQLWLHKRTLDRLSRGVEGTHSK